MPEPLTLLGGLTPQRFLERHWHKRPLVVRGAVVGIDIPSRDGLIALARRADVRSRLIRAPRDGQRWSVQGGPLVEFDLAGLAGRAWTLLVQECDRHHDGCAALLERFRFIPNWRIDDVMVSYATDGGGVGPHIDRYDVFLIQAAGRRRWRFGGAPLDEVRLEAGSELPVLAEFRADEEQVLEPGDLLYLPPRFAHEGVAIGECVTCSVGFRVPDPRELCASFLTQLAPQRFERMRYTDPELSPAEYHGEIPGEARKKLRDAASALFSTGDEFDRWVGCFVTRPLRGAIRRVDARLGSIRQVRERLAHGAILVRSAPSHFAWFRDEEGLVHLFAGGEAYPLGRGVERIAELLCGRDRLDAEALRPLADYPGLLDDLLLRGLLEPQTSGPPI